jgi:hypothetical protein
MKKPRRRVILNLFNLFMKSQDFTNLLQSKTNEILQNENNYVKKLLLHYFKSKKELYVCEILEKDMNNLSNNDQDIIKKAMENHKLSFIYNQNQLSSNDFEARMALMKNGRVLKLNPKWHLFKIKTKYSVKKEASNSLAK